MTDRFVTQALASHHDRTGFTSGSAPLDRYFQQQVTQDIRRRVTACYVALDAGTAKIAGFYTLAASGVPLPDLPDELARRLPRYPLIPIARLGRLAVDQAYRGRGLGAALLWNAATRAARSDVAVFALVVDAKDAQAESFYRHHGFLSFGSLPGQLILPLARLKT